MPHQVIWPKCNIFSEDGEATTLERGDFLPDGVDATQLETLSVIGAVRPIDFAPSSESAGDATESETATPDTGELQKPSADDTKAAWVDYASDPRNPNRMERTAANSMSKQALMDKFKD